MTLQEFNRGFKPFLDFFPTDGMTKEKINIYFAGLSDLTLEQLNLSFTRMIKNRIWKNFPQPAEIRQYALGSLSSGERELKCKKSMGNIKKDWCRSLQESVN